MCDYWSYFQNIRIIRYFRKMLADHEPDEFLYPISMFGSLKPSPEPFQYVDPALVSGVLKGVVADDLNMVKQLVESGKSVNINDNNGNTPLHVAVIKYSPEIITYLLTRDELVINSKNFWDETALLLAVRRGHYDLAEMLVENGAEINKGPLYPLHAAVHFPKIAQLLLDHGADVDVISPNYDTPLHDAITAECIETVYMLLYYNADVNINGDYNLTPFMKALIVDNVDIQLALLDYVTDFNATTSDGNSLLMMAVRCDCQILKDLIERGARFHDNEYLECYEINNYEVFKLLWGSLVTVDPTNISSVLPFLEGLQCKNELEKYATAIMENEQIMQQFSLYIELNSFVSIFGKHKLLDLTTKFTFIYLKNGYQLYFRDIKCIYEHFHICELILLLRYFNFSEDCTHDNRTTVIMPRILFMLERNISFVESVLYRINNRMTYVRKDLENCFELFVSRYLRDVYQQHIPGIDVNRLPTVPSLTELTRNKTKEYLMLEYKLQTASQYYTFIDSLHISDVYKRILKYEKALYAVPS